MANNTNAKRVQRTQRKNTARTRAKRAPALNTAAARAPFMRTDAGNGELFAALFRDKLRFDHKRKRWLGWRTHWWEQDTTEQVLIGAKNAARYRLKAASELEDDEERRREVKWAVQSESRYRLGAMVEQARAESPLAEVGENWDSDPWLLGVGNGVVDLRTGTLRPGRPEDHITVHLNIAFDPTAQCPRWLQFLDEIFLGNKEMVDFMHRAIGYSLTGDTREQCIFLCWGSGANGKSTMLELLHYVLGDYAFNLPFSAFELQARSGIPNDVAAMAGRRFVTAVETSETARWNEARIKALTGQDKITGRFLYHEHFQFTPTAKFWLAFNHKPVAKDDSYAFWRRVRVIPFTRQFKGAEADKDLLRKLQAEAPGILAWAVRGCLEWQKHGLGMPPAVEEATEAYREESDHLGRFVEECCLVHEAACVPAAALRHRYEEWCKEHGERPLAQKDFAARLKQRGFKQAKLDRGRIRCWRGVGLPGVEVFTSVGEDTRTGEDA
jgi:putative DNA primase/helicase